MINKLLKFLKGKFIIEPKLTKLCQDFDNNELDKDVEKFAVDFVHNFHQEIEDPDRYKQFQEYKEMWIQIVAYFIIEGYELNSIKEILMQEMTKMYK